MYYYLLHVLVNRSIISVSNLTIHALSRTFHHWTACSNFLFSYKELEATLPQKTLYALSEMSCVQRYTARSDCIFYQLLVEILIPDVLKPIPSELEIDSLLYQVLMWSSSLLISVVTTNYYFRCNSSAFTLLNNSISLNQTLLYIIC